MWSLGCVIAELFLGWPLYPGASEYDQVSVYLDGDRKQVFTNETDSRGREVLTSEVFRYRRNSLIRKDFLEE